MKYFKNIPPLTANASIAHILAQDSPVIGSFVPNRTRCRWQSSRPNLHISAGEMGHFRAMRHIGRIFDPFNAKER